MTLIVDILRNLISSLTKKETTLEKSTPEFKPKSKKSLLNVENLKVFFSIQGIEMEAVRGVSFEVFEGEAVGIVGESGSGKSACVQAITGLNAATKIEGKALFEGKDLLKDKVGVLGKKIGMVFQDPMTSLNPTMKIGAQIEEGIIYHKIANRKGARKKALDLLKLVGVPKPELRLNQYPHNLSGGMRQRVLIAIAIAANPQLLIADEPTTALDQQTQKQILNLLQTMQKQLKMSLILITHDLSIISKICDRVFVFYAGKIVESGTVSEILQNPRHPYTQMLLKTVPRLDQPKTEPLRVIEGAPPNLSSLPRGCSFQERCPFASSICNEEPPFFNSAACWRLKK